MLPRSAILNLSLSATCDLTHFCSLMFSYRLPLSPSVSPPSALRQPSVSPSVSFFLLLPVSVSSHSFLSPSRSHIPSLSPPLFSSSCCLSLSLSLSDYIHSCHKHQHSLNIHINTKTTCSLKVVFYER